MEKATLLKTKWAVRHLFKINKAILNFEAESNGNLLNIINVMQTERDVLIAENENYSEAKEILESINCWMPENF